MRQLALMLLLLSSGPLQAVAVAAAAEEPAAASEEPTPAEDWAEIDDILEEDWLQPDPAERDPLEPMNRSVHGLNEGFLSWVVQPVHRAYRFVVPAAARRGLARFFSNLHAPVILVNDVLQLAPVQAGETSARFVVNSTLGIGGLFDPATPLGLPGHETDFGETLAAYWTPSGPYLVVPILGPSTVRDAVGEAVDGLLRPDVWFLGMGPGVLLSTGSGMATYDIQKERLEALRETSVDYYAALRGAYLLDRDAQVDARVCGLSWRACVTEEAAAATSGGR